MTFFGRITNGTLDGRTVLVNSEKENPCLCPLIIRIPTPWLSACLISSRLPSFISTSKERFFTINNSALSAPNCRAFCKPVFAKSKKFLLILFPTLMILFKFYSDADYTSRSVTSARYPVMPWFSSIICSLSICSAPMICPLTYTAFAAIGASTSKSPCI